MDALNLAFTRMVTRTQRKSDATVTVEGVRFEVPSRFRCLSRLTLRHAGWDLSRLVLVDPDRGNPLAHLLPQDKEKNASGQRRTLEPVEVQPATSNASPKEIPALLRKWLADYAAIGLPPAYLAVQEGPDER
jgi:hypothetical protein